MRLRRRLRAGSAVEEGGGFGERCGRLGRETPGLASKRAGFKPTLRCRGREHVHEHLEVRGSEDLEGLRPSVAGRLDVEPEVDDRLWLTAPVAVGQCTVAADSRVDEDLGIRVADLAVEDREGCRDASRDGWIRDAGLPERRMSKTRRD